MEGDFSKVPNAHAFQSKDGIDSALSDDGVFSPSSDRAVENALLLNDESLKEIPSRESVEAEFQKLKGDSSENKSQRQKWSKKAPSNFIDPLLKSPDEVITFGKAQAAKSGIIFSPEFGDVLIRQLNIRGGELRTSAIELFIEGLKIERSYSAVRAFTDLMDRMETEVGKMTSLSKLQKDNLEGSSKVLHGMKEMYKEEKEALSIITEKIIGSTEVDDSPQREKSKKISTPQEGRKNSGKDKEDESLMDSDSGSEATESEEEPMDKEKEHEIWLKGYETFMELAGFQRKHMNTQSAQSSYSMFIPSDVTSKALKGTLKKKEAERWGDVMIKMWKEHCADKKKKDESEDEPIKIKIDPKRVPSSSKGSSSKSGSKGRVKVYTS
ncbi:P protein [Rose virus R]|uniref:P protein n=1 Tax=Rose virus R TaxID=2805917 RepID=A0AAE7P6Y1_9RHAB|nr:P protein [Rose virus R]QQZ02074.1 P protein [Rose virus R]